MEIKRKTPFQLESLEQLFLENKYPTQTAMEDQAADLGLTYEQVRGWFIEKRRDKREDDIIVSHNSSKELSADSGRNLSGVTDGSIVEHAPSSSKYKQTSVVSREIGKKKKRHNQIQDLLTTNYILQKVFRKDGPPLGVEFDSLPSDHGNCHLAYEANQRASKRRKVPKHAIIHTISNEKTSSVKQHGIGKGLMTVWRATNPHGDDLPTGIRFADREVIDLSPPSTSKSQKSPFRYRRTRQQKLLSGSLQRKVSEKKKPSIKRREVQSNNSEDHSLQNYMKCELALKAGVSPQCCHQVEMLVDDEELELSQLQSVSGQSRCCDHFAANGLPGCSLCKDLLDKFPPNSVQMKQPFCVQPWGSSTEIVKELFKVFHFIYTYSVDVDICPFTLDDFAQAFHEKDSLLLGKIHVALLKLLLSDVEAEHNSGLLPQLSKSCNFLVLLHSVEKQDFVLDFWKRFLNPLTWTEILRQVLVAAGFGSKQGVICKEALSKEMNLMSKYDLCPGTLKGELFKILFEEEKDGLEVSELAKRLQNGELKFGNSTEELECLISSALSSDITLFEKISSLTYRLRINSVTKKVDAYQSDTEDSLAVDDFPSENDAYSSDEDYVDNPTTSGLVKINYMNSHNCKINKRKVFTEIDESHPGEVWVLGLMEGEYSSLSIEEKLNALVALVNLLRTTRMEDHTKAIAEYSPNVYHSSSGAKIKRSTAKKQSHLPCSDHADKIHGIKDAYTCPRYHAIDSSTSIPKFNGRSSGTEKDGNEMEVQAGSHPMQSVFLGSDRRYSRYWLLLGPCNANDPGHRRVYFESSEDGHWEVIDTEEAFCALLSVLDDRGKREALLIESLEKRQAYLRQAMSSRMLAGMGIRHLAEFDQSEQNMAREESSSPASDVDNNLLADIRIGASPSSGSVILELGKKGGEQKQNWRSLQEFDSWIWDSFYLDLNAVKHGKKSYFDSLTRCQHCHDLYWRDEKHCRICHTTFEIDFDLEERYVIHTATCRKEETTDMFPKYKVLSSQIQSLKAAIHAIESSMPEGALVGAWRKSAHKLWVKRLRRTSSVSELWQVLADFVGAINKDWLYQCDVLQGSYNVGKDIIAYFTSMPHTTSAVALWLVKLDAFISPYLGTAHSGKAAAGNYYRK